MKSATLFLAFVLLALLSPRAEAAPLLIGWGEKISEVAPLPSGTSHFKNADVQLGYRYSSLRLFFVPVITWDGRYVYYSPAQNAAEEIPEAEMKAIQSALGDLTWKGGIGALWAKYVDYLLAVVVALFIVAKVFRKKTV